jgi:hypothetical protein
VGALFSSEVTFTQEMTFWEGGEQRLFDEDDEHPDKGPPRAGPGSELASARAAARR